MKASKYSSIVALATALCFARELMGQDRKAWRTTDAVLASGMVALLWIDAAQTRHAMRLGYYERNPVLVWLEGDDYPSDRTINAYMLAVGAATLGAGALMPRPWRTVFLAAVAALELRTVVRSCMIGVGLRF